MNSKAALGFLAVLAAFIVLVGWAKKRATEIDTQSAALQRKVTELQNALDKERSQPEVEKSDGLAHEEKLELMRLRNEVTQLRASNAALAKLEAENARLATGLQNVRAQSPSSNRQPGIERDQWNFQGYSTPEAAYMSALWALKEGQVQTVLASFTPEERQRFETDNQGGSPEEIADVLKKQIGSVSALRITRREQVSPTEVVLQTQMYTSIDDGVRKQAVPQAVRMRLVDSEWKTANAIDRNTYDPLAFYRKNPELMKRYFPHLFKEGAQPEPSQGAQAIADRYGLGSAVPAEQPAP